MNRSIIFAVILCYFLDSCGKIYGEPISVEDMKMNANIEDKYDQDFEKRGSPGGMWFGPRLGKRSKEYVNDHNSASLQRILEAMSSPEYSASNYGMSGSKRRFTPRLGRDSSEQEIIGPSKSVDFIPRLGRELTPGLLRAILLNANDLNTVLYGRAIGEDRGPTLTESKVPPFAPRLGREMYLPFQSDFYGLPRGLTIKDGNSRIARSADNTKIAHNKCAEVLMKSSKP